MLVKYGKVAYTSDCFVNVVNSKVEHAGVNLVSLTYLSSSLHLF